MAHFAKIENGVVTQVIVAEQEFIDSGSLGDPTQWIQTSYNGNIRNTYVLIEVDISFNSSRQPII